MNATIPLAMMRFNLMRMATIGLASLYMVHLLALDFVHVQRIFMTNPVAGKAIQSLLFRSRRDVMNISNNKHNINSAYFHDFKPIEITNTTKTVITDETLKIKWNHILENDPFHCIPLLTCQLIAGVAEQSLMAMNLKKFIEFSYNSAPNIVKSAHNRGLLFLHKPEMCYSEYPFCIYSTKMMLKLLEIFIDVNFKKSQY